MSRAFVNEDDAAPDPRVRFPLPAPDDAAFPMAAARALLQGANEGDSASAEAATGYLFGDRRLIAQVKLILEDARAAGSTRLEQLAERFLVRAGEELR